jgi:pimeloyl-ACP methyl ester carboxylesterase
MAGYMIRCFVGKYPKEVAGVVLVDVSHPDQFNRFPKELDRGTGPSEWLVRLASSIGVTRLFYKWNYAATLSSDSINIIHNAYDSYSLSASMEESRNFKALAEEAGKISSFGNIPLIVITGTSESRSSWMPDKNLEKKSDQIWMQLQDELMQLSTNSEHMYAPKAGHYVQLEQPEMVVDAIRKILAKADNKPTVALQVK